MKLNKKTQDLLDEFEYSYAKNVGGWIIAEKDSFLQYKDFMDL